MATGQRLALNLVKSVSSRQIIKRNFGLTAIVQIDPVQNVFLQQVKKYEALRVKQGGGAVDAGKDYETSKTDAINRLKTMYGVNDPSTFPTFEFKEPDLDKDEV